MKQQKSTCLPDAHQGFTLIELIMTLALMGIIMAFAVPSIVEITEKNRIKGATERLAGDFQLARSEAVLGNETITVSITTGATWCYGFSNAGACNCNTGTCDRQVQSTDFSGISLSTTLAGATTAFSATGPVTNSGRIQFDSTSLSSRIAVNAIGRVRICSDDFPGWQAAANC